MSKLVFCNLITILLYLIPYTTSSTPPEQRLLQQILLPVSSAPDATANTLAVLHRPLQLEYGIFRHGRSSLRDVAHSGHPVWLVLNNQDITKTTRAALCLLLGQGDVAHEVLLGVDPLLDKNIESAEYAAQHPGETSWMDDHPLSDMDDILHAILHRCEGEAVGEGGHTGWANAKYWAAGGPKAIEEFVLNGCSSDSNEDDDKNGSHHPTPLQILHKALVQTAHLYAPRSVAQGVVVPCHNTRNVNNNVDSDSNNSSALTNKKYYSILAAGRTRRTVQVHAGAWDPFRVIDLCASKEKLDESTRAELECLIEWELRLLLRYELLSMRQKQPVDVATLLGQDVNAERD